MVWKVSCRSVCLPFRYGGGCAIIYGIGFPILIRPVIVMSVSINASDVSETRNELPDRWRPFFWDCAFDGLDLSLHREFVIGRILSEGDWDAVIWLRRSVGDALLRAWIERRQGKGLSPQQLRFWELILELPTIEVDRWLTARKEQVWDVRASR